MVSYMMLKTVRDSRPRYAMRRGQIAPMALSSCYRAGSSHHLYWLELTSNSQVLDGFDEDQELRGRISKVEKGPMVEGSKGTWFSMSTSDLEQTRRDAYL